MKASSARALSLKNKTKINKKKANEYIAEMYTRVKVDATNGNYSSFVDIPKEFDNLEYDEYIKANMVKQGYSIVGTTLYDVKAHRRAYKISWDSPKGGKDE